MLDFIVGCFIMAKEDQVWDYSALYLRCISQLVSKRDDLVMDL